MALRFRLNGLAETFIEEITCPCCKVKGSDDEFFSTELTKVTYDGIVVVVDCKRCGEIFVPQMQKLGIIDASQLKVAVEEDHTNHDGPVMDSYDVVCLNAECLNAMRKGEIH